MTSLPGQSSGSVIDLDTAGFNDLVRVAERLLAMNYPEDIFTDYLPGRLLSELDADRDPGHRFVVYLRRALEAIA